MLREGRAEIGKFKQAVEKGVGDAKAIYTEVTGLFGWIKSLFGAAKPKETPKPALPTPQVEEPKAKKANKKQAPPPELTYEEYKIRMVNDVCEHLKTFFEIKRKLQDHCAELEEISKTTTTIEDSAIDRVAIEIQLEDMSVQIREAMVYAPAELRDIYSRFLKMYEQILEEQEFDRQVKRKQERDAKWRQELLRNHRIDRAVIAATVLLVAVWMWAMLLSLGWLVRTRGGLSSLL